MTAPPAPLPLSALNWRISGDLLGEKPLPASPDLPGQVAALEALGEALRWPAGGHLMVGGLTGPQRLAFLREAALQRVGPRRAPRDLVYVARPRDPARPRLLVLPAGSAAAFRRELLTLRDELRLAWPEDLDAGPGPWAEALGAVFRPMVDSWPAAGDFLDELHQAVVDRADLFRPGVDLHRRGREGDVEAAEILAAFRAHIFHRAAPGGDGLAPVVVSPDARPDRLFGGIHPPAEGAPPHTGLRPGLLHAAHGGLLILDAAELAPGSAAWRRLRAALLTGALAPDSLDTGVTPIQPDPVPLDLQVALVTRTSAQRARWAADPDLRGLFRRPVLFRPDLPLDTDGARAVGAWLSHRLGQPLPADVVAAILEDLLHRGGRGGRLPLALEQAEDLARAAVRRASAEGGTLSRAAVDEERRLRRQRTRQAWDRALDSIERELLVVQSQGQVPGQANGLAVYRGSGFAFARPIRITATVGAGRGGLTEIERDAGLSGKLHNKGVRTLLGLLRGRFSREVTLAIQGTLGIEQHYGQIDGDSASLAEACALISAIAQVPLRQDLALSGSIDQLGRVQSVGSVTLKVEGFHAVCARQGLSGTQGVLVPRVNVADLCLADEVLADIEAGRFHVWGISTLEEALALLTGLEIGTPGQPDSLYGQVHASLQALEQTMRRSTKGPGAK